MHAPIATQPILALVWPVSYTVIVGIVGLFLGVLLDAWSRQMARRFAASEGRFEDNYHKKSIAVPIITSGLFVGYCIAVFDLKVHYIDEVQSDDFWRYGRAFGHLVLIALLVVATATDFREYIIPDQITIPGTIIGFGYAVFSGDVQIMHLWVNWNRPAVELLGPEIPEWIRHHRHYHALAWSSAGMVAGGAITWLVRWISSMLLGQETIGMGDVTLMVMIGSFIGWQPIVFVFLIAPLFAIVVGLVVRQLTNKNYLPYGPYLSIATVVVLVTWNQLWPLEIGGVLSIRKFFGDAPGMVILAGTSVGAFVFLLAGLRLYHQIPGKQRESRDQGQ